MISGGGGVEPLTIPSIYTTTYILCLYVYLPTTETVLLQPLADRRNTWFKPPTSMIINWEIHTKSENQFFFILRMWKTIVGGKTIMIHQCAMSTIVSLLDKTVTCLLIVTVLKCYQILSFYLLLLLFTHYTTTVTCYHISLNS